MLIVRNKTMNVKMVIFLFCAVSNVAALMYDNMLQCAADAFSCKKDNSIVLKL